MISVILIEPAFSGNIGSIARAMNNFGIKDLILANPCEIDEEAYFLAVHAKDTVQHARIVDTFEQAKEGFDLVIGTSAIRSDKDDYFLRNTILPEQLREKLETVDGKVALVLGREGQGMKKEELEQCDLVVTIPTSKKYKALNLSHAGAILFYELFKSDAKQTQKNPRLANEQELSLLKELFTIISKESKYTEDKQKVYNTMISRILGRALITGREVNTLIGMLKDVNKKLGND